MVFIGDDTNIDNDLDMRLIGRNDGPMVVVLDESSNSSLCDACEECKEQVGDGLVANEEAIKIPTENDGRIEKFKKY